MRLTFRSGERAEQVVELRSERSELGRDPSCDLTIPDVKASRRHARIDLPAQITDLGSSNGTFVGGEPLGGPRELRGGEEIRIGDTVLAVEARSATMPERAGTPDHEPGRATEDPPPLLAPGWDSVRRPGDGAGRLRDHPRIARMLALGVGLAVFGTLSTTVLGLGYRVEREQERQLLATGERVTARVERRNEDDLFIVLPLRGGRVARTSVDSDPRSEMPERSVEVAYDPRDPTEVARVDGAGEPPDLFAIPVWLLGLVALLICLPLWLVVATLRSWRKLRRALDPARRRVERSWACARTMDGGPGDPIKYSTILLFDRPDGTATRLVADTWPGEVMPEVDMAPITLEGDIRVGGTGTLCLDGGQPVALQGFRRPRLWRRRRPAPLDAS